MPDNKDKERLIPLAERVNKKDLEIILEVNRKAVEIETAVADQNEEIIDLLNYNKVTQEKIEEKVEKILKQSEETSKDIFKMQVLFITGLLALVAQIIQFFLKR
jgi:Glu-tRNA(Gln) amidotransferase subunit E-like FAD-binding protein